MTDASLPVTQSAVEQFTQEYLVYLGATIEAADDYWQVSIPEDAKSDIAPGNYTLVLAEDPETVEEDETRLAPASQFFQRLIDDARKQHRVGVARVEYDEDDPLLPDWLTAGNVEVENYQFSPYYDRTAVVVLFHVGIETVSEYQTERLQAVAVDTRSGTELPGLESNALDEKLIASESDGASPDHAAVTDAIAEAREIVTDHIRPRAEEIREKAARAADVELEEFRRLKDQRIQELEEETNRLSERIEELNDVAQTASSRDERTNALRERKELRAELEEKTAKLDELRDAREAGFPEKRRKIRDRHDVTVRIEPVTVTLVRYEKGEIDLSLSSNRHTASVRLPYGGGVGVTDPQTCGSCEGAFSESNPAFLDQNRLVCGSCRSA